MRPPTAPPSTKLLSRAALALYPPSWRVRYADEVRALLDDSGAGLAAVASVAWHAVPAWLSPPSHLHDRPTRMRSSLARALMSWSILTGLGLIFAQLTQFQGFNPPGHPEVRWAYAVFDAGLVISALVAVVGGLPLWVLMLRRTGRERRPRHTAYLLLPVLAPAAYLLALIVTIRLAGGARGVSPWWFAAVSGLSRRVCRGRYCRGRPRPRPGLALRRLQPRGPALRLAAVAAGVAAAVMAVAAAAIVVAVTGLCLWARGFASYHHSTIPAIYLVLVVAAATITTVSAARGTRAALAAPASG
jgi:hypothetical protein